MTCLRRFRTFVVCNIAVLIEMFFLRIIGAISLEDLGLELNDGTSYDP